MLLPYKNTPATATYTLSLHDALPILQPPRDRELRVLHGPVAGRVVEDELDLAEVGRPAPRAAGEEHVVGLLRAQLPRSEEHTSELQSQSNLVCRLLLEKKNLQWSPDS